MKTLLLNIWTYFLLAIFTVVNLIKNLTLNFFKLFKKKVKVQKITKITKVKFNALKYTGEVYPLHNAIKKGYGLKGIAAKTGIAIQTLKDYRGGLLVPLKMKLVSKKLARSFYGVNAKLEAIDSRRSFAAQVLGKTI